jgi:uridine phosphorylase
LNPSENHPFPFIIPEDLTSTPLFTAAQRLEKISQAGLSPLVPTLNGIILLHQARVLRAISRKHHLKRVNRLPKELYLLRKAEGTVGIVTNFGVGAPAAAVAIEELAVFGIKKLVAVGIAGGLQEEIREGNLVICERAIREEGTSHHYLLPSRYAFPSPNLACDMSNALDQMKCTWVSGSSWTTDAPYRETNRKAAKYRNERVLTVEMEAAAVFAVCKHLGIESVAAFTVADSLPGFTWQPAQDQKKITHGLVTLFEAALKALGI